MSDVLQIPQALKFLYIFERTISRSTIALSIKLSFVRLIKNSSPSYVLRYVSKMQDI